MGETFLFCVKRETENQSSLFDGCGGDRGSLDEKGFGSRSASKLALGFQALFRFAAQTRTALPSGLPLC